MKTLISREQREAGFTLIELLVVILIIGILAAIAIPMFLNQRKGAVEASLKSDLRNNAAIITGAIDNQGHYPQELPASAVAGKGVTLDYHSKASSYCLKATHTDLNVSLYYDSALDGVTANSCSLKIDGSGDFYQASPGRGLIYNDTAGEWVQDGVGPSGEPAMRLRYFEGQEMGWGVLGTYNTTGETIPAGSTVSVSYYIKGETAGLHQFEITNHSASEKIVPTKKYSTSTGWQRQSRTFTTSRDWISGTHFIRWALSLTGDGPTTIYVSDVQVDIL